MVNWLVFSLLAFIVLYAVVVLVLVIRGRRADARALAGFIPDCVILSVASCGICDCRDATNGLSRR